MYCTRQGTIQLQQLSLYLIIKTISGLEDVLKLKVDNQQHPNVAIMLDELSEFIGKLSQDPTFEPNFLSMFTAKVFVIITLNL